MPRPGPMSPKHYPDGIHYKEPLHWDDEEYKMLVTAVDKLLIVSYVNNDEHVRRSMRTARRFMKRYVVLQSVRTAVCMSWMCAWVNICVCARGFVRCGGLEHKTSGCLVKPLVAVNKPEELHNLQYNQGYHNTSPPLTWPPTGMGNLFDQKGRCYGNS